MHTILSFDIGTRHLAYCALRYSPSEPIRITNWQVVDLMSIKGTPYDEESVWVMSKSWKVGELRAYLDGRHLSSVGTRDTLIKRIHTDLKQRGIKKTTSMNLCVLASKLYAYLDTQLWMLTCDTIVLENQPCLTNPVMKSVQMLLYGYFLYRSVWQTHQHNTLLLGDSSSSSSNNQQTEDESEGKSKTAGEKETLKPLPRVMLTSATNKLKVCKTMLSDEGSAEVHTKLQTEPETEAKSKSKSKSNYKQRKKDAIALTNVLLQQWQTAAHAQGTTDSTVWASWIHKMTSSNIKEQDDLSDSLLQGLYVLHQHVIASKATSKPKRIKKKPSV